MPVVDESLKPDVSSSLVLDSAPGCAMGFDLRDRRSVPRVS